jgi:hypothetical protein
VSVALPSTYQAESTAPWEYAPTVRIPELAMPRQDSTTFNQEVIKTMFSPPGSDDWHIWDDAYHWVSERPGLKALN